MTDAELDKKIQDIKAERDRLGDELRKYEQQRESNRNKEEIKNRRADIGKCYLLISDKDNLEVMAFKILSVPDQAGTPTCANCLVIKKHGVSLACYNIWCYAKMQMIVTDPTLVIDHYFEIGQDVFDRMLSAMVSMMNNASTGKEVFKEFLPPV